MSKKQVEDKISWISDICPQGLFILSEKYSARCTLLYISMGLIHPYSIPLLMTCVSLVGKLEL
jgi:hypothetical protein